MSLKTRIERLEAGRENADQCRLCELVAAATYPPAEAAAMARHPRHTLEQLVIASMAEVSNGSAANRTVN